MKIDILGEIEAQTAKLDTLKKEEVFSAEPDIAFTFNLEKPKIEFIRNYVNTRRENPEDFHYSNSSALREGIELLRENFVIGKRPKSVKNPIRIGRPTVDVQEQATGPKIRTSFYISKADKEFIYDFIYAHSKPDVFFGKEKFFDFIINVLSVQGKTKGKSS